MLLNLLKAWDACYYKDLLIIDQFFNINYDLLKISCLNLYNLI